MKKKMTVSVVTPQKREEKRKWSLEQGRKTGSRHSRQDREDLNEDGAGSGGMLTGCKSFTRGRVRAAKRKCTPYSPAYTVIKARAKATDE